LIQRLLNLGTPIRIKSLGLVKQEPGGDRAALLEGIGALNEGGLRRGSNLREIITLGWLGDN
jgi:hypothetical protein